MQRCSVLPTTVVNVFTLRLMPLFCTSFVKDYHYYPWGNEYFNTTQCGGPTYDKEHSMFCWLKECGGANPPDDCFKGKKLCQHGPQECSANTIEGCAIALNPSVSVYSKFLVCFEVTNFGQLTAVEHCARSASINASAIQECASGARGEAVDVANARATARLQPVHQGTPWVTINGQPVDSNDLDSLLELVCRAYQGSPKPKACTRK